MSLPRNSRILPALAVTAIAIPLRAQVVLPSDSAIKTILQSRVDTKQTVGIVVGTLDHGRNSIFTAGSSGAPGVAILSPSIFPRR